MNGTLGEIRLWAGNRAPSGWAFCHGQEFPVSGNDGLFALLGSFYGGDGRTKFNLPDLRGRVPVGAGQGDGLSPVTLGASTGSETTTSETTHITTHTHSDSSGTQEQSQSAAAGGQAYDNRPPSLGLNYIICISGEFPTTN